MIKNLLPCCTLFFLLLFIQVPMTSQVVINEINYHSSDDFDTKDWLEFYNTGDDFVNIGFWYFKDDNEDNIYTFPEGTLLEAGAYLVVCRNIEAFTSFWPEVDNYMGEFDFGLNNGGELIRLFNASGTVVDTVHFDDESPWPLEPDGFGPTLQLSDPTLDNANASNWFAATGTPGAPNVPSNTQNPELQVSVSVFPNPVVNTANIRIDSPGRLFSGKLLIFNNLGQQIQQLSFQTTDDIQLDTGNFSPGFYTLNVIDQNGISSTGTKFIVVR